MSTEHFNAYVLHSRAYRDSSALVDVFCREEGRFGVIAKGARGAKSRWRGILQPFMPLTIDWKGKGELKTLVQAESIAVPIQLTGTHLMSGFYLNELLVRLTHPYYPLPDLFEYYTQALKHLQSVEHADAVLRPFEMFLLQEIGYGFSLTDEASSGDAVESDQFYQFDPAQGLIAINQNQPPMNNQFAKVLPAIKGELLLAIANQQWQDIEVRRVAKQIMRVALFPHLGDKPLESRKLFMKPAVSSATKTTSENTQKSELDS